MWSILSSVQDKYANLIIRHPFAVLISAATVSIILSTLGLIYGTKPELSDPKVGFETRNTDLSGRILTWRILDEYQLNMYADKDFNYFRRLHQFKNSSVLRKKRSHDHAFSELLSSIQIGSCLQINHPFKEAKWFSHLVLKSTSASNLFSMQSMEEMCDLQDKLNSTFEPIRKAIKYPNFWALPNYLSCMSGYSNCSLLTQSDVDEQLNNIRACYPFKSLISECYNPENDPDDLRTQIIAESINCSEVLPEKCRSKLFYDLYHFILSNNFFAIENYSTSVYINMVLPIMQLTSYQYEQTPGVDLDKFQQIHENIMNLRFSTKHFEIVGLNLGFKLQIYGDYINQDSVYCIYCAFVTTLICLLYSGSLFYSGCVLLSLIFSLGVAYFIYCIILVVDFFPFINFLVIVLLVGIGADNTFVLKHIFDHGQNQLINVSDEYESDNDADRIISERKLRKSIIIAAKSMFITNATTAAAFYANYISDVIVMKCFGLFAGTTMVVNYLLIISFLPASLIIHERFIKPKFFVIFKFKFSRSKFILRVSNCLGNCLYNLAAKFRYLWTILFTATFITSILIIFYKPGLQLPRRNPILLFKKDNPMEWYDENAEDLFDVANDFNNQQMDITLLWGFEPENLGRALSPEIENLANASLKMDGSFNLTLSELELLGIIYENLSNTSQAFEKSSNVSFYKRFIEWSLNRKCLGRTLCCNIQSIKYSLQNFIPCLLESTKTLDFLKDGPIFDARRIEGPIPAFTISLRTAYKNSLIYSEMKNAYQSVNAEIEDISHKITSNSSFLSNFWWVTNDYFLLTWYDLQKSLLYGTPVSIAASVFIALLVVILSTRTLFLSIICIFAITNVITTTIACLVLLGWNLNVVESTIIILTAGLAFDFTLLYAAAYKIFTSQGVCKEEKIKNTLIFISLPIFLSALTTCSAGLCMLPAYTMAYFQIGLFMVLVTLISWILGSLYFTSMLLIAQ